MSAGGSKWKWCTSTVSLPPDLVTNITSIKGLDPIGAIIVSHSFILNSYKIENNMNIITIR